MSRTILLLLAFFFVSCTAKADVPANETITGDPVMMNFGEGVGANDAAPLDGYSRVGTIIACDPNSGFSMQVEFPKAGMYTVEFNLTPLGTLAPNHSNTAANYLATAPLRAEALISWSVAGNEVSRRISVGNGVSISGAAQAIRVQILDTTEGTLEAPGGFAKFLGIQYQVQVIVAPGTRAATAVPPRLNTNPKLSASRVFIGAGGQANFAVPQDAGVNSVHVDVMNAATAPIPEQAVQVDHQGFNITKSYDPRSVEWAGVETGTTLVTITNNVANGIYVTVTFGIDG